MNKESDILPTSPEAEIEKITRREVQLLQLIADGYQNKEIAGKLHLAPDTIKKSLYRLYLKLNVKNRTSAVSKAVKMGLIKSV
jgi:DNA-binding NarL/FixJ family response regulator